MMPAPPRYDPTASQRQLARVQIWSAGEYVDTSDEIVGGSVTEKHGAGVRSSLSLTVEPTRQWREWLTLPDVSLMPWSGFSWGRSEHLWPHGVFPIRPQRSRSWPAWNVTVAVDDAWSRVIGNDFLGPTSSDVYPGLVINTIAWLLGECDLGWPDPHADRVWVKAQPDRPAVLTAKSSARIPPGQVWNNESRSDLLLSLCKSIGADAYLDRWGIPVIEDHSYRASDRPLIAGESSALIKLDADVDTSKVRNRVVMLPTGQQSFSPVMVQVEDPTHPAHRSRIGVQATRLSSNVLQGQAEAAHAASIELAKLCEPALGWTSSSFPDPTRESGDLVQVAVDDYAVEAVALQVVHPLGEGDQKTTWGARAA